MSSSDRKISVLIVDDSPVAQTLLTRILEEDPGIQVAGVAGSGEAAIEFVRRQPPDAVLMDIHMRGMDGFEATRRIMESHPVPIVVCSAVTRPTEVATAFRALEVGAVACVEKPVGPGHEGFDRMAGHLRQTVKLMSEVKVVRRWRPARLGAARAATETARPLAAAVRVVGIGASTGGPQVLQQILAGLPKAFPVPILVVQHIANGFLTGLAEWLRDTTGFQVQVGAHGVVPQAGHVYLAPDDFHMGLGACDRLVLTREARQNHVRPAVSYLFQSLADACGPAAIGVLLTGMGKDGALELLQMKEQGAVTIAQDAESAVVNGMPGEAVRIGGAVYVLPPERIAERIVSIVQDREAARDNR